MVNRGRRAAAALGIALGAWLLTAALDAAGAVARLELLAQDARYATGIGRRPPGADIVIAWIDQASLDYMEQEGQTSFPWPREVYAQVLQHLRAAGARAVAFDLLFDQHGNAADDREFAAALAAGPGDALAIKFAGYRAGGRDAAETAALAARGRPAPAPAALPRERGAVLPVAELAAGAEQLGFVNIAPDADKAFRHYDVWRAFAPPGGAALAHPSLAAAALLAGGGAAAERFAAAAAAAPPRLLLNFRGPAFTFAKVKFVNVLQSLLRAADGQPPLHAGDAFRDKYVLVGVHADGYEDAHPTPLDERFPGVELHATALDNLLRGDWLQAPDWGRPLAAAAAALATAAVFLLPGALAPSLALLLLLGAGAGAALWAWAARLAVPVAAPALAFGTAAAGAFLHRLVVEGRQRREMRRAFQSYLSPAVLREVLRDPAALRLGGELREVTLLFTDLQGFTGLAEHSGPQQLVAFLNDYFTRMCAPVLAERGVVDKFLGDAIMAFFGAPLPRPDHAAAAVRAALAALQVSAAIAAELRARGLPPVATRIGVHSGPAVVGNMGSSERFDYTAIGDTVNLASRLEGANKAFGTQCLVSAATWAQLGGSVLGREVGRLGVAGRQAPIAVHEPLAAAATATAAQREFAAAWQPVVASLRAGDRAGGAAALQAFRQRWPDDPLAARWAERLADPAFTGEFRLDSK